jgi:squalene cyclase
MSNAACKFRPSNGKLATKARYPNSSATFTNSVLLQQGELALSTLLAASDYAALLTSSVSEFITK